MEIIRPETDPNMKNWRSHRIAELLDTYLEPIIEDQAVLLKYNASIQKIKIAWNLARGADRNLEVIECDDKPGLF